MPVVGTVEVPLNQAQSEGKACVCCEYEYGEVMLALRAKIISTLRHGPTNDGDN